MDDRAKLVDEARQDLDTTLRHLVGHSQPGLDFAHDRARAKVARAFLMAHRADLLPRLDASSSISRLAAISANRTANVFNARIVSWPRALIANSTIFGGAVEKLLRRQIGQRAVGPVRAHPRGLHIEHLEG